MPRPEQIRVVNCSVAASESARMLLGPWSLPYKALTLLSHKPDTLLRVSRVSPERSQVFFLVLVVGLGGS